MSVIIFRPITKRERELVQLHGEEWILVKSQKVQCFNNNEGCLIKSKDSKHSRWVEPEKIKLKE